MSGLMIWCTCAEDNKRKYLKRVAHWYEQINTVFGKFKPDCYVFVDGVIAEQDKIAGPIFVNLTPKLGRSSVDVFPGWKRSLKAALQHGRAYKYVIHIENDVKILNTDKIFQYMKEPGMYVGVCKKYGFIETAFMILNDRDVNRRIVAHYSDENNLYEHEFAEEVISRIAGKACNLVFDTDRMEDPDRFNPNYDFVCQYAYEPTEKRQPMSETCKTCVFYDPVDDLTFWCDVHGACTTDNLRPCSRYIPTDDAKKEEEP